MSELPLAVSKQWWKDAVVYQIYPISYCDSNGDGFGDLNGITSKLDYIKSLGVDVIWLSPIYKSPLADYGYDISDYLDIDPRYGTLADWDNLLKSVHDRGMKLIMDLVVNHTSDEHEWFVESRSSKDNPKRDWYIWRPPKYDAAGNRQPPNNWRSVFQGSAWKFDETTGEYYLHLFVEQQPDLNWENPAVRDAVWDLMKFWLNRGCDGFRMDVINSISKVAGLPDVPVVDPIEEYQRAQQMYINGPRVHEYLREMHEKVLARHDLMTVGEAPFTYDTDAVAEYVLPKNKELQMVFQFELVYIDAKAEALAPKDWKVPELARILTKWQNLKRDEGFWNAVYIENHDQARSVSRFGDDSDEWRSVSAKMLALLPLAQSGTLYVYQGQELGLRNFPRSWGLEEYKDIASQNYWSKGRIKIRRQRQSGSEDVDMTDVLDALQKKARDHGRVPMQWDSTANAGFTTGTPWMRVNDDYKEWNAATQADDSSSVLNFWKGAIALRKQYNVLTYGDFQLLEPQNEQVLAVRRTLDSTAALVILNFSKNTAEIGIETSGYKWMYGNYETPADDDTRILKLRGYEGMVFISEKQ
ncbi:glycoside hydrolase family 13 protein [Fistulina hepatica ATCC 64428]|uniref:Glycoside hydrolase family 13 protein n=1 Tax=Fistulina hepatica ATCC 64428 TaxID=1128425 RepID=A0A0D7AQG1_9AGAR|nr:glycoside hydrolase family 13 protein [Fistulina hepatica ATCC 64428]